MLNTAPIYNLKAVLKETGLAPDTLRAWERRYGLPSPQRSEGGQRLYSQYDVELIKWLMARTEEGLSISRAAEMWKEHIAAGVDLLASEAPALQTLPSVRVPPGTTLDAVRAHWLEACLTFNEAKAEQILTKAFAMFPLESVCTEVLQKGLADVGRLWYENKASVQQEHFTSALAMRRLDSLMSAAPAPTRKQTVIVGCPASEWHTFTPLMMALFLRRRGLNVVYLGADVPAYQFEDAVKSARAQLVILAAQSLITAASLQAAAEALRERRIPAAFGGRIFSVQPDLQNRVAGYYLGAELALALETTEQCLKGRLKPAAPKPASPKIQAALRAFLLKRAQIEIALKESLPASVLQSEGFQTGVQSLGDNIVAALRLGDVRYVEQEMEWVKTLMQFHKSPPEALTAFMRSYAAAVNQHMNGAGAPIKDWLAARI